MSYTLRILRVKTDDWSEETVFTRTQTETISGMNKPNVENPRYIVIWKGNEVLLFDRSGSLKFSTSFPNPVSDCSCNSNGYVAAAVGDMLFFFSPTGGLLYSGRLQYPIYRVECGDSYIWVIYNNNPPICRIYSIPPSQRSEFVIEGWGVPGLSINKEGTDSYIVTRSSSAFELLHYRLEDLVRRSPIHYEAQYSPHLVIRSSNNYVYHLVSGVFWRIGAYIGFCRTDGFKVSEEYTSGFLTVWAGSISSNGEVSWYGIGNTIKILKIDVDNGRVIETFTMNLPEPVESTYPHMSGDITPDGRYSIVQCVNNIYIIDNQTYQVVKTIPKSFSGCGVRVLTLKVGG